MSFDFFRKSSPAARPGSMSASDPVDYQSRIKAYPMLSETEEHDLLTRWYKNGERKAHEALIGSHLRLVPKIAQKYAGYGIDVSDLISEGNVGLLQSVERFKPEKGFRFSTYARWWIKAAILNYILQSWSLIKLGNGANKKRLFFNLRRAKRTLKMDNQRSLSDQDMEQLAHHFRVTVDDVKAMDQRMSGHDVSLSQPLGNAVDGDSIEFGDTIADEAPTAEDLLIASDDRVWRSDALRNAIKTLDEREQEIVARRYLTERPATLSKLATLYGLTAERVRQIEAKAIAKLKHYLRPRATQPAMIAAALAMFFATGETSA